MKDLAIEAKVIPKVGLFILYQLFVSMNAGQAKFYKVLKAAMEMLKNDVQYLH